MSEHYSPEGKGNELDAKGKGRRMFLAGSGAFLASSLLPHIGARAEESVAFLNQIVSREDKERNVLAIRDYEQRIRELEAWLTKVKNKQDILAAITHAAPPTERSVLQGTELDWESFFRQTGSWPSAQVFQLDDDPNPRIAFSHQNISWGNRSVREEGNIFFVDNDTVISNEHAIADSFRCEVSQDGNDIAGCSLYDLGISNDAKASMERISVERDRRRSQTSLHGKLIHIPSLRLRGTDSQSRNAILSSVAVKITPNFLYTPDNPDSFFSRNDTENFGEQLLNSYICLVPPQDLNGDGAQNADDLRGKSGSPIFTNEDCADQQYRSSGIQWGGKTVQDRIRHISFTFAIIHGPDVFESMVDQVNTIVSMELDEATAPAKRNITTLVQRALYDLGNHELAIDGLYGNGTRQAVSDFQQRVFDRETIESSVILGVVDRLTWNALFPQRQNPNKKHLWRGTI